MPGPRQEIVEHVPARRAPGLLILLVVVLAGLVPTSIYFHWKVPGVIEEFKKLVASAPKEPAERLRLWFQMNAPQVHNRLLQFRLSQEQPWMVVYALAPAAGAPSGLGDPLDVWGIDLTALPVDCVRLDGLDVVVSLEAPRSLGVHRLSGDNAGRVPRFASAEDAPPAAERALDLVEYALRHPDDFLEAFELDNPGARFVLRVGERERVVAAPAPPPVTGATGG